MRIDIIKRELMKKPLKIKKTENILVNNKQVDVVLLPFELQCEIQSLDEIKQRITDCEFETEILLNAYKSKHADLLKDLNTIFSSPTQQENQADE